MREVKRLGLAASLLLCVSIHAYAEDRPFYEFDIDAEDIEQATLKRGCQITTNYPDSRFNKVVSKDDAGTWRTLYWFKTPEKGVFTNEEGSSKAEAACTSKPVVSPMKKIILPSKQDYEALFNCFTTGKSFLSRQFAGDGKETFTSYFKDWGDQALWTSTQLVMGHAYYFHTLKGMFGDDRNHIWHEKAVVCAGK